MTAEVWAISSFLNREDVIGLDILYKGTSDRPEYQVIFEKKYHGRITTLMVLKQQGTFIHSDSHEPYDRAVLMTYLDKHVRPASIRVWYKDTIHYVSFKEAYFAEKYAALWKRFLLRRRVMATCIGLQRGGIEPAIAKTIARLAFASHE